MDTETNTWKGDGCVVDDDQPSYFVCACTHLTQFGSSTDKEMVKEIGVPDQATMESTYDAEV